MKMPVDRVHGLWTARGWPVHGSMVDHRRRPPKSSPELALGAALVGGSSPAIGEIQEEVPGFLTEGFGGRCGEGGRPATRRNERQRWSSVGACFEAGRGKKRNGRSCGETSWRRRCFI
jgi:hypothetical protein